MKYESKYIDGKYIILKDGKIIKDDILLGYLRQFYEENGRVPITYDFSNNLRYPNYHIYINIFGNWNRAIELVGLLEKRKIRQQQKYTDEELLGHLRKFYEENGRPPTMRYFIDNPRYPSFATYQRRFGSWENALKTVGLDTDSMARKGVLETDNQKARLAEILVLEHFPNKDAIDLSGKNCTSYIDGICPKRQIYDVKSSKLYIEGRWRFTLDKLVDYYYLLAFNEYWTKLLYAWRIPGDFMNEHYLHIGISSFRGGCCIDDMKKFDITEKFRKIKEFEQFF